MRQAAEDAVSQIIVRIKRACAKVGRDQSGVLLVAVSKLKTAAEIQPVIVALKQNQVNFVLGENYVQEWKQKANQLAAQSVHLIGALQRNKARDAVALFDCIQSVDSERLALELNKQASKIDKKLAMFLQVNISNDLHKHGLGLAELERVVTAVLSLENLIFKGLMTITQNYQQPEQARADFRNLRQLADKLAQRADLQAYRSAHGLNPKLEVSMGMSQDFEVAIEEGADVVRVGTALFGERGV